MFSASVLSYTLKPFHRIPQIFPKILRRNRQKSLQIPSGPDYSSAFNTIVPTKLAVKLSDLGLNTSLCDWIQDFLTARPQVVKVGQFTSNSITLNIGAPQGCVLSPLLYSLYTHDCVSSHSSTSIIKFADDTVVLGLVSNNDEAAYLDEVERLTSWCLSLSLSEREQNQRADCRLQEETAAALHPSYDQWDPCGEGEQLQVPRCKHLRGPDLDCTHPNTGQESQAKTVPSASAEEIQGLTSYPENFLFRGHRKCSASQCGIIMPQTRTAKLCRESCV